MKKILFVISILFTISVTAQTTWQEVSTPTTKKLNTIDFPSPTIGYIGGEDSLLLKTTDGGVTWIEINFSGISFLPNGYNFMELDFVTEDIGFATVGPYTGTYKTEDGGSTWVQLNTSGSLCYNHGLYFTSPSYGFVGGAGCFQGENMDKFVSGSASPVTINSPAGGNDIIVDIDFNLNSFMQQGLAVSNGGRVLKTTDAGDTWDTIPSSLGNDIPLTSVTIVNDTLAYAGYESESASFGLLRSTDAGLTWATDNNSATFHYPKYHDVYSTPFGTVYSGGTSTTTGDGVILESDNSGFWSIQDVDHPIYCMTSYSDTVVWGVGDSGYVVTNTTLGQLSVDENEVEGEQEIILYPNPATDQITVKLPSDLNSQPFEIAIYSLDGKRVKTISSNATNISISNLKSGTYIVRLRSAETIWSTRLVKP